MGYYLADGIYPGWATFVKTISCPQGLKNKHFVIIQEARCKDVERAFRVLQAHFAIVHGPAHPRDVNTLSTIMKAYNILHNMIIEDEGEPGDTIFDDNDSYPPIQVSRGRAIEEMFQNLGRIRSSESHTQLKLDLIKQLCPQHSSENGDDGSMSLIMVLL
ncbi:uncharacterized protein LOC119985533 [Tripterygium wilfordii]|uniref:uncharacterized protein LOC119985533 n=1 Tax=Tripterygium wilfordii TaxID=458696 RepID=UPI0018F85B45|nr:uncharacterized protein LOC119985533 [Tripterygium wilfordii]